MENPTNITTTDMRSGVANVLLRRRSKGQAIVILALFLMLLMGVSGVVYDLGFARHELARAQRAADAAALAGVVFLPEHFTSSSGPNAQEAAWLTAQRHGYSDRTKVISSQGTDYGARLRVEVTSSYTTAFMNIFGFRVLPVKAVAIAEYNHPITMGAPEPYLGIGNDDPRSVTYGGDPAMRMQGHWLSMHMVGTEKSYGDPFMVKWDPPNGYPFAGATIQPDYDTKGYSFGINMATGSTGYLQIFDPAYQTKILNNIDATHPCGDGVLHTPAPYASCSANGPDYNFPATHSAWCSTNTARTGDNQPNAPAVGPSNAQQCSTQAQYNNTYFSLYYPDSTPWYFADDVLADSWTVAPGSLPVQGVNVNQPPLVYSNTWVNFKNTANPGYQLYPVGSYHQWRLNVNNDPNDTHNSNRGSVGQNQYAIRMKTNSANVNVYAIQRLPVTNVLASTTTFKDVLFYLANIPAENAGKTLIVSLFDPGDFNGQNFIQLISPYNSGTAVTFHAVTHSARHNPDQFDTDRLNTFRDGGNNTNFDDEWVDVSYRIPNDYASYAGYWKMKYTYGPYPNGNPGGGNDRTAWRISIRGNPVHLVLGGS